MAGALTISTLNNDTGVLATQNGMTGIAKAWVNFNGTVATPSTIRDSFNVTSVTKNGTADYTINFTTAMPNANYSTVGSAADNNGGTTPTIFWLRNQTTAPITTAVRVGTRLVNNTDGDSAFVCVAVFSS